jgi:hypothetical protein
LCWAALSQQFDTEPGSYGVIRRERHPWHKLVNVIHSVHLILSHVLNVAVSHAQTIRLANNGGVKTNNLQQTLVSAWRQRGGADPAAAKSAVEQMKPISLIICLTTTVALNCR